MCFHNQHESVIVSVPSEVPGLRRLTFFQVSWPVFDMAVEGDICVRSVS
jgi:hypothetical protein